MGRHRLLLEEESRSARIRTDSDSTLWRTISPAIASTGAASVRKEYLEDGVQCPSESVQTSCYGPRFGARGARPQRPLVTSGYLEPIWSLSRGDVSLSNAMDLPNVELAAKHLELCGLRGCLEADNYVHTLLWKRERSAFFLSNTGTCKAQL